MYTCYTNRNADDLSKFIKNQSEPNFYGKTHAQVVSDKWAITWMKMSVQSEG